MMRRPEQAIQRSVFAHIRARAYPSVFAFAVPNGGYRRKTEAAILKGMGVRAGVPDLILIHGGEVFCLELKSERGRATAVQRETIIAMEAAGAHVCVATGLDEALTALEQWGLLRGATT
jgi:hypothetical protein